jgi:hypothetical protein
MIAPLPAGKYSYHCELHPIMRGTFIVIESQARSDGAISANMLSTTERNTHVHFKPNRQQASQRIEAETVGVSFRRPTRPKFQNSRRNEL